jgi:phosphoenolpyruvate carboxykinase (ATP)
MFNGYVKWNPTTSELYKDAIIYDNLDLSSNGALLAYSGEKTGRSPKDKRIVKDENTKNIWWGNVNIPMTTELFNFYKTNAIEYLNTKTSERLYQIDVYAGWEDKLKIRLYCTTAYHALFMLDMLIPSKEKFDKPDFTIYNVGELALSKYTEIINDKSLLDDKLKDTLVAMNVTSMEMLLFGTRYAGEMKKSVLTLMMYLMPIKGRLPLHSSANVKDSNLCFFFGLSGTGKTTLSSDSDRNLIGDDEHVWTDDGVYNIEGGCYAKCINLKEECEPEIYRAIRYGAVLENVVHNKYVVDYESDKITENTRCVYPLDFIPNALIPATVKIQPENIILLVCDTFGLFPPVARLSHEQAVYFFISGYTSKVAGTEVGVKKPEAVFSACFGEPFIVWNPKRYGELLKEKLEKFNPTVWLLNTGWVEGAYGVGHRISIKNSRTILNNIHKGKLINENFIKFPIFNFEIPTKCDGVDTSILDPRNFWANDLDNYLAQLDKLNNKFIENYTRKCD